MPIFTKGVKTMPECKHEFIGTVSGVCCKKCSLLMTAAEYGKYIKSKGTYKAKKAPRKRVNVNE